MNFYPQSDEFAVNFQFTPTGGSYLFGLSGDTQINCELRNEYLYINNTFIKLIEKNQPFDLSFYGSVDNITAWTQNKPVYHPISNSFVVNSTYSNFDINESIFISQPNIGSSISGIANKSGTLRLQNSGAYPLSISSIIAKNSYFKPSVTTGTIPPSSFLDIPIQIDSFSSFSGLGTFELQTNAGSYEFSHDLIYNFPVNYSNFEATFRPTKSGDYKTYNFSLYNKGSQDILVEMFFNFGSGQNKQFPSGANYTNYGAITYPHSGGGFFTQVIGTGLFTEFVNEPITGFKTKNVSYSGLFSGRGGALQGTGYSIKTGTINLVIYAEGVVNYNYRIPVSSVIGGYLAFGVATGTLSGMVGPGSGSYYFNQQIIQPLYQATLENGTIIFPTGDNFTGSVDANIRVIENISGNKQYYVYRTIDVYEGQIDNLNAWSVDYYDYDRGFEDFYSLSRYTATGYGSTGITYRIPASGKTSGQVRHNADNQTFVFRDMLVNIANSSLNQFYYLNNI